MSGDETDTASGVCPKFVRRVEIPWLSPRISQLVHAMDSYEPSVREESMYSRLGNTSLARHYEPCKKNTRTKAISSLPRNWYDDVWFRGLSAGERTFLSVLADVELPSLVSAIIKYVNVDLIYIPGALPPELGCHHSP